MRPIPVCTSSHTNSVPASRHRRWAPGRYVGRGNVDALSLDRLDDERRHVAAGELLLECVEVAEADGVTAGQQRPETLAELGAAVERQRAERQPVEGVLGVQHTWAPGGGACDLDRRLDRLRAGVRRDHRGDAVGGAREQLLGEHAAEQRHPELRQVPGARGHHLLDRCNRLGVVAPDREHAVAAEQVQIALPVGVDQMCALAARPYLVESERAQDPPHLRVQIAVVQRHLLACTGAEDLLHAGRGRIAGGYAHALSLARTCMSGRLTVLCTQL